jgi:hypothetical protein
MRAVKDQVVAAFQVGAEFLEQPRCAADPDTAHVIGAFLPADDPQ